MFMMKIEVEEIIRLYIEDMLGCHVIGRRAGLSCNQIARILKKNGIVLRTLAEGQRNRSVNSLRYTNVDFFKNINMEEKAYWLGFIVADGSVSNNKIHSRLTIGLKPSDRSHLEKINKIFNASLKLYQGKEYFHLTNVSLCEDLIKLGVVPDKTHKDDYNFTFDNLSDELKRHYLRGLFDGDGTVYYMDRQDSLGCGFIATKQFSVQIKDYTESLLGLTSTKLKHYEFYSTFQYRSKKDVSKILSYLYDNSTLYLDRKYNLYQDNKHLFEYKKPSNQYLKGN